MEYCLAMSSGNPQFLEREVNSLIKEGWKPQGGVFILPDEGNGIELYQPMIRLT